MRQAEESLHPMEKYAAVSNDLSKAVADVLETGVSKRRLYHVYLAVDRVEKNGDDKTILVKPVTVKKDEQIANRYVKKHEFTINSIRSSEKMRAVLNAD